jgi:hypothetical protein
VVLLNIFSITEIKKEKEMPTPQLSPGVLTREVDLTVGRADNVLDNIGAIAGPFKIGPVDDPVNVTTEQELINFFGEPDELDGQWEYWMTASSFLSYGGVMKVVRTGGDDLVNANAKRIRSGEIVSVDSVGIASTTRTPAAYSITDANYTTDGVGSGANFTITVADNGSGLGSTVTVLVTNGGSGFIDDEVITVGGEFLGGNGATDDLAFNVNGVYADSKSGVSTVGNASLQIKNFDDYNQNYADDFASYIFAAKTPGSWANNLKVCFIDDKADQTLKVGASFLQTVGAGGTAVGLGVSVSLSGEVIPGAGTTSTFTGFLQGIITGQSEDSIDVKIISRVDTSAGAGASTQFTRVDYNEKVRTASFRDGDVISVIDSTGSLVGSATTLAVDAVSDWYDNQTLALENSTLFWKAIAPKPTDTQFAADRNGRSDAIHVVIIDDTGDVTGIQGNILEKFLFLSKATDAVSSVDPGLRIWWKEHLAQYSKYVYVGDNPSDGSNNETIYQTFFETDADTGYFSWNVNDTVADGLWNAVMQDARFSVLGNATYNLSGGNDYLTGENGKTGSMKAELGDLITSYGLFTDPDEIEVDYLLQGPGLDQRYESQAKANYLISLANGRKDCIAVISPHRYDVVSEPDPNTPNTRRYLTGDQITDNVIEFFNPLTSSSYAIFDSGYKYTFDRFNNKFRYVPCNGDVAGLCVRTSIFAYPWFSPAGQQRGTINNAIKLAYNPNKSQRDRIYPKRINPVVNKPGFGVILFGDKTGLGYASAFDRINVRRLFLTIEQSLAKASETFLFELNDEITRANFVNIVEPYLRDIKAKRGLYGYLIKCDETNNTPDIIDNNEFRADIFLKPAKSINYITLTYVATRTGVAFEEVAGTV